MVSRRVASYLYVVVAMLELAGSVWYGVTAGTSVSLWVRCGIYGLLSMLFFYLGWQAHMQSKQG